MNKSQANAAVAKQEWATNHYATARALCDAMLQPQTNTDYGVLRSRAVEHQRSAAMFSSEARFLMTPEDTTEPVHVRPNPANGAPRPPGHNPKG